MKFSDAGPATRDLLSNPLESTFMLADTPDKVEGFFQRPQLIFSEEWSPNISFFHQINPWQLYFENDKVRERLSNFYLLRASLKIKILINSTPFYYGRLMASYNPMGPLDKKTVFRPGVLADFVEASQRPSVVINPSTDQTAEICMPYVFPKSALIIPAREWRLMGDLVLSDLTQLRNANEATDSITVSIFAWAENVSYSQPTSFVIPNQGSETDDDRMTALLQAVAEAVEEACGPDPERTYHQVAVRQVPQNSPKVQRKRPSRKRKIPNQGDEYDQDTPSGVVSKPASTLARWAGLLSTAPYIGPYMKATSMISGMVAGVAALFGFSRPRNVAPANYYIPGQFRRLAQTNAQDETDVLALDIKKEVPIDPRIVGCGPEDPMALVPLAMRESFLTNFDWSSTQAPEALLWNCPVQSMLYTLQGAEAHMTPMCWVNQPFKYWRGGIRFRFEVVASKFHRGRLRLVYDPLYQTTTEYNVNYSQILDIQDGSDVSMDFGWAQGVPYLITPELNFDAEFYGTTPINGRTGNGVVSVFVLNSLTTPSAGIEDIQINVYVSALEDFEVADPDSGPLSGLAPVFNGNDLPAPIEDTPFVNPLYRLNYVQAIQSLPLPARDVQAPPAVGKDALYLGVDPNQTDLTFPGSMELTYSGFDANETNNTISFDLVTTQYPDPETALGEITVDVDGNIITQSFSPPDSDGFNVASFSFPVAVQSPTITISSVDTYTTPLFIRNQFARVNNPSQLLDVNDLSWVVESQPVDTGGNSFGTFIRIFPNGRLRFDVSGTSFPVAMMYAPQGPGTFTANGIPQTCPYVIPSQQNFHPGAAQNGITVENTGTTVLYFYNMISRVILNQGSEFVVPNQGAEVPTEDTTQIANSHEELPNLANVFFGEVVSSIRQILKRYTLTSFIGEVGQSITVARLPTLPLYVGSPQLGVVEMSLWDWFIPGFIGYKGSVRHKFIPSRDGRETVTITRIPRGLPYGGGTTVVQDEFRNNIRWSGSTAGSSEYITEAEIPWYSNLRFAHARAGFFPHFEPVSGFEVEIATQGANSLRDYVRQVSAIGEDFSTYMFICCPVIYRP